MPLLNLGVEEFVGKLLKFTLFIHSKRVIRTHMTAGGGRNTVFLVAASNR